MTAFLPLVFVLLATATLIVAALAPRLWVARAWAGFFGWLSFVFQVLSAFFTARGGASEWLLAAKGLEFGVRLDGVTHTLLLVATVVGAASLRFSVRYLEGDPKRPAFLQQMWLVLALVQTIGFSPSLLQLGVAGLLLSRPLLGLLLHSPERLAARRAAWSVRLFFGLGDVALLTAVAVTWATNGTTRWAALGQLSEVSSLVVAACLALAALSKTAQLPFQVWLLDTLETPTPVSALLHAGVINAGGFLLIRGAPVLAEAPAISSVLAVIGALTAAYGAVVMLTQNTVKGALAYSTVAQMGFMILQCGLGAYGLALLHIAAHSLYKAHAFLRSGSVLEGPVRRAVVLPVPAMGVGLLVGASIGLPLFLWIPTLRSEPGVGVWLTVLLGASAYCVARFAAAMGSRGIVLGSLCALSFVGITALLHLAAVSLVSNAPIPDLPSVVEIFTTVVFVGLLAFQFLLARLARRPFWRRGFVHAYNGFYFPAAYARAFQSRASRAL